MICFPNSKINIGLHITRRRDDGYHDIETIFVPTTLSEVLEVTPSKTKQDAFDIRGLVDHCPLEHNLVYKALLALRKECSVPAVDVTLIKQIPSQAGLGGGSADAAYMLQSLVELFDLKISPTRLTQIAASLGADCPFFLSKTAALGKGIGNRLTPICLPPELHSMHLVVVKPPISISTAQAYAQIKPDASKEGELERLIALPIMQWTSVIVNDFEKSLFPCHPELQNIKDTLYKKGAIYASLSGSGSALYGFFKKLPSDLNSFFNSKYFTWCGKIV